MDYVRQCNTIMISERNMIEYKNREEFVRYLRYLLVILVALSIVLLYLNFKFNVMGYPVEVVHTNDVLVNQIMKCYENESMMYNATTTCREILNSTKH